ncbi:MAG: glycosyl transferase group 1 [Bacilli bacterium]|nr:glycosyl transferase group 1 [Bacilli bacterium]
MNNLKKVIFITNIPTPYRIPWWNKLNEFVNLHVVFMDKTEKNRKWDNVLQQSSFKYNVSQGLHFDFPKRDWTLHINPGVLYTLIRYKPQKLILGGYDSITSILALGFTKFLRVETILWYESTQESENLNSGILKKIKRSLIKSFSKYAVPGESAKANLICMGVKPENIYIASNVVNNNYFYEAVQVYKTQKSLLKERLGLTGQVILFVGQLIERKGLQVLLNAYIKLEVENISLLIVGDGPLRHEYERFCADHELYNVRFAGFQDMDSIPEYFAAGDLFVLPSYREVWGLVVNEAMASGLPVLCSKYAGCSYDLILEGVNGYTFDPNNEAELTLKLREMLSDLIKLEAMGEASTTIINQFTIETSVRGIVEALN